MGLPKHVPVNIDVSSIKGNASDSAKTLVAGQSLTTLFPGYGKNGPLLMFGHSIANRLKATELSLNPKVEESRKKECRLVYELTVEEGEFR